MLVPALLACTDPAGSATGDTGLGATPTVPTPTPTGSTGTPAPTTVSITSYSGRIQTNLAFVAFQDGDGPWTEVDSLAGRYTFSVGGARYGAVVVCVDANSGIVRVTSWQALTTDLVDRVVQCGSTATVQRAGSLTHLRPTETGTVSLAYSPPTGLLSPAAPSWSGSPLKGDGDAVITVYDGGWTERVYVQRNRVVQDGSYPLDFDARAGDALEVHPVYALEPDGTAAAGSLFGALVTRDLSTAFLAAPSGLPLLAESSLASTDLQRVEVRTVAPERRVVHWLRAPADLTLTLPPAVGKPTITVRSAHPSVVLAAAVDRSPDVHLHALTVTPPNYGPVWTASATDGWMEDAGSNEVVLADPTAEPGWRGGWDLPSGEIDPWTYTAVGGTGDRWAEWTTMQDDPPLPTLDGVEVTESRATGQIEP